MSETASGAACNRRNSHKPHSVGKPVWGVQMRVVGPDGEPLPAGLDSVGEILISGHHVMKSYHNNPDGTAAALQEGWLSTGDLGYVDGDGFFFFFFIVDRLKDLVIRGGYNGVRAIDVGDPAQGVHPRPRTATVGGAARSPAGVDGVDHSCPDRGQALSLVINRPAKALPGNNSGKAGQTSSPTTPTKAIPPHHTVSPDPRSTS